MNGYMVYATKDRDALAQLNGYTHSYLVFADSQDNAIVKLIDRMGHDVYDRYSADLVTDDIIDMSS